MAGEPIVTLVGNLADDPELRFTPSGAAVANFRIGITPRVKNGDEWEDGTTTWVSCHAWRDLAENVAESLQRGARVIVQGRMSTRTYTTRDGREGSSLELEVDAVGPDLRWATAKVTRSRGGGGGGGWNPQTQGHQPPRNNGSGGGRAPADDPWASPARHDEEPPF